MNLYISRASARERGEYADDMLKKKIASLNKTKGKSYALPIESAFFFSDSRRNPYTAKGLAGAED